jgi:hypothetical protein
MQRYVGHPRDTRQVDHKTIDEIENVGVVVSIVELECTNGTLERRLASELRSSRLRWGRDQVS